jgi:hypothetical protein
MLDDLPEVSMVKTDPHKVLDDMLEYGGLCYLHTADSRIFLIQPAPGVNRLVALNKLTNLYITSYHVARTLNTDVVTLREEYPDLAALVVFPKYTVDQVLQIAKAGNLLPAGITRFVIPGRVLRLNLDLSFLKSEDPLPEKNAWLTKFVIEKQANSTVRYYAEPVYLLDE